MLLTAYTLNMIVHSIMYSYYFASIYIKDFDKVIAYKKSITIMQMVSDMLELPAWIHKIIGRKFWTRKPTHFSLHNKPLKAVLDATLASLFSGAIYADSFQFNSGLEHGMWSGNNFLRILYS